MPIAGVSARGLPPGRSLGVPDRRRVSLDIPRIPPTAGAPFAAHTQEEALGRRPNRSSSPSSRTAVLPALHRAHQVLLGDREERQYGEREHDVAGHDDVPANAGALFAQEGHAER